MTKQSIALGGEMMLNELCTAWNNNTAFLLLDGAIVLNIPNPYSGKQKVKP
jgi:hypothetical protein